MIVFKRDASSYLWLLLTRHGQRQFSPSPVHTPTGCEAILASMITHTFDPECDSILQLSETIVYNPMGQLKCHIGNYHKGLPTAAEMPRKGDSRPGVAWHAAGGIQSPKTHVMSVELYIFECKLIGANANTKPLNDARRRLARSHPYGGTGNLRVALSLYIFMPHS